MFHSPKTTQDKVLEIVTSEWQYFDNDEFNFDESKVVPVKEQRRMGTQRGNKTTPQAPAIEVRAKGLPPVPVACRCRLWNFGSCLEKEPPRHDGSAQQLTMLRANVQIDVTENVAMFGPLQEDGYRYARLRCFITRGARVQCRKFHIAFYLDCLYLPPGMATPGPDDSSFPVGDSVEDFPWARSARMSISEKAMCPRLHDKTKRSKTKASKVSSNGGSSDSESESTPGPTSPKRLKRSGDMPTSATSAPSSVGGMNAHHQQQQAIRGGNRHTSAALAAHAISSKKTPSPSMTKGKKELSSNGAGMLGGGPVPMQSNPMLMHSQLGPGIPPHAGPIGGNALYNSYMDRNLRMSRFSFPGLEDEMFQHPAGTDESDLVNMESALGQGRRSSQFIGGQYWPSYQQNSYYLNQTTPGSNTSGVSSQHHQQQQQQQAAAASVAAGNMNGITPTSIGATSPMSNQSPTFGTLQTGIPFEFSGGNGLELNQRRLSASGGGWHPDIQHRRISSVDLAARLSTSPLPPHQPGRGPEWEALFEAHAKALSLDKNSPEYLSKKTSAWAEVYRAAEMIEQKLFSKRQ